jgi:1,4-alpha-glucan branching enzyme
MKKAPAVSATKGKAKATVFKIQAPGAKKVVVAGSFNNWDTGKLKAKKDTKGNWAVKVDLNPGKYEYKFFIDGSWMIDPCSAKVVNSFGSENSVVEVK